MATSTNPTGPTGSTGATGTTPTGEPMPKTAPGTVTANAEGDTKREPTPDDDED